MVKLHRSALEDKGGFSLDAAVTTASPYGRIVVLGRMRMSDSEKPSNLHPFEQKGLPSSPPVSY